MTKMKTKSNAWESNEREKEDEEEETRKKHGIPINVLIYLWLKKKPSIIS